MTVELREGLRQREIKSRRERGEEKARPTDEANVWESQSPATQDLVEVLVDFEPVAFGSLREKRSGEDQLLGSDDRRVDSGVERDSRNDSKDEEEQRKAQKHERSHHRASIEDLSSCLGDKAELGEDDSRSFAEFDESESGEARRTTGDEGSVGLVTFEEARSHDSKDLEGKKETRRLVV